MKKLLLAIGMATIMAFVGPGLARAEGQTHSPTAANNLVAPTCSALIPNVRPPNCVDYNHVFSHVPACSAANPGVIPPACFQTDLPLSTLTPGSSYATATLNTVCAVGYESTVPALGVEVPQQVFVNYGYKYGFHTGACTGIGGCTIDNLVPISIGGDQTLSNLWPIPTAGTWNATRKTALNAQIKARVCSVFQDVNVGGNKTAGSTTGLVNDVAATSGYQFVNFSVAKAGGDATGLGTDTAGYQFVLTTGTQVGTDPTGLTNDTTVYTATITVDGVAVPISIVGSAAQTYTTLISEINTDLGASATASLVGGDIRVISATNGATSTVSMADTTLFAAVTGFTGFSVAVNGTTPTYTASISVNGTPTAISVVGSAAQTFTTLLAEINVDLGVSATATLSGGNIKVTSATTGASSTIAITDTNLFNTLTSYSAIATAVGGNNTVVTTYTATITVDGVAKPISLSGGAAQTYTALLAEINTDLGASATASLANGNIRVTSATTGVSSSVAIVDSGTNHLFATLTGYVAIIAANNTQATLTTVTAEMKSNWQTAYTKYITNHQ